MDTNLSVFTDFDKKISDSEIVPDDIQMILMYLRDSITAACFQIGDIANRLVSDSLKTGMRVTDQRIFEAVGKFCGKTARTVRYYAETAAFFDGDSRSDYETLPFSFFVFARSMAGRWKEVLDFALDNQGSTLEYIRFVFLSPVTGKADENKSREISQPLSGNELDDVESADELMLRKFANTDADHSEDICENSQNILGKMGVYVVASAIGSTRKSVSDLRNAVSSLDIEPFRRQLIETDIAAIDRLISIIAENLSSAIENN